MKDYRKPEGPYVPHTERRVYETKEAYTHAAREAAITLGRHLGFTSPQLYTHSLPEAILSHLRSMDSRASVLAAIAFLEETGHTVTKNQ